MIAGSLQFTLGLQVNQFLGSLGIASGRLLGFTSVAAGLQIALRKMWDSIQQGGRLRDLAAGAGTSVKALYQLQEAFKQVGASADRVPAILLRMQRTLGTKEGQNALASMGLDPKQLAAADPAAQMERIAQAMAKMNVNAAGAAAFKLFGREGAMTFRQISGQAEDFSQAIRRAAGDANVWQKVAFEFDNIADKVTEIEGKLKTLWALFTGAAIAAFQKGDLSSLITDIIVTGFQAALDILPGMVDQMQEIMKRLLPKPLQGAAGKVGGLIDRGVFAGYEAGYDLAGSGVTEAAELEKRRQAINEILRRRGRTLIGEHGRIPFEMESVLGGGFASAKSRFAGLNERMLALIAGLPQGGGGGGAGGAATFGGGIKVSTPSVTSIERMGFIFNRSSSATDYARATATNTQKTVALLQSIEQKITDDTYANQ